jgi:hypothetical protein
MLPFDSIVFAWFRTRARHVAATVLVSLAAFGASLLTPHADDCHDHGCVAAAVQHDAAAHRYEATDVAAHEHPLHCVACHWARSLRPPRAQATFVAAPAAEEQPRLHVESYPVARPDLVALPPLRSPPPV